VVSSNGDWEYTANLSLILVTGFLCASQIFWDHPGILYDSFLVEASLQYLTQQAAFKSALFLTVGTGCLCFHLTHVWYFLRDNKWQQQNRQQQQISTSEHWIQHITFTAETNGSMRMQSHLSGHTHSATA